MTAILNDIIAIGGTTAYTDAVSEGYIRDRISDAPETSAWHVAETEAGEIVGFQWVARGADYLPMDAAEIATFAKAGQQGLGIGSKLFEATRHAAKALGYRWINANIRADNASGLTYYQSRGFEDYGKIEGLRLADGTVVDKILKRFDL
ncbi:GNAT family N-acetyltransferase [Gymnodinialimonas ulvae]|uniref:GNAT family N-acetyltransferase n=1 Tax=Gymnodinialimonas ulvae TaxID=3126504 RepID=UPI0030B79183